MAGSASRVWTPPHSRHGDEPTGDSQATDSDAIHRYCRACREAGDVLRAEARGGDLVLCKASRRVGLDRLVEGHRHHRIDRHVHRIHRGRAVRDHRGSRVPGRHEQHIHPVVAVPEAGDRHLAAGPVPVHALRRGQPLGPALQQAVDLASAQCACDGLDLSAC